MREQQRGASKWCRRPGEEGGVIEEGEGGDARGAGGRLEMVSTTACAKSLRGNVLPFVYRCALGEAW